MTEDGFDHWFDGDDKLKLSASEIGALRWLGQRAGYIGGIWVSRRSRREFDLSIEGKQARWQRERYTFDAPQKTPYGEVVQCHTTPCEPFVEEYRFTAWLPLACLREWWGDKKWGTYVNDYGTGDWSFVRDADIEENWATFHNIVTLAREQYNG